MGIKKYIPNTLTCLNLFSGCIASVMAFKGDYNIAFYLILLAAFFDFLDGFAARLLKAYSEIGKDLDSLADMISFGMAPGLIMFSLIQDAFFYLLPINTSWLNYIAYLAFVLPVFSALRLAKFNVDENQTSSFIGLPTPANSIFFASLAVFLISSTIQYVELYLLLIFLFSYLMVSPLPMFSFKLNSFSIKKNITQYVFILLSALILFFKGLSFLFLSILLYIIISLIKRLTNH